MILSTIILSKFSSLFLYFEVLIFGCGFASLRSLWLRISLNVDLLNQLFNLFKMNDAGQAIHGVGSSAGEAEDKSLGE